MIWENHECFEKNSGNRNISKQTKSDQTASFEHSSCDLKTQVKLGCTWKKWLKIRSSYKNLYANSSINLLNSEVRVFNLMMVIVMRWFILGVSKAQLLGGLNLAVVNGTKCEYFIYLEHKTSVWWKNWCTGAQRQVRLISVLTEKKKLQVIHYNWQPQRQLHNVCSTQ